MARFWVWFLLAALWLSPAWAQKPAQEEPPEEDETIAAPKDYSFNPLQAEKELQVGKFYSKKGSHRAAAQRFREATRWNPGLGEAYLRLGESLERIKDFKAAREAYAKYAELESDEKKVEDVRRRIAKLPADKRK